MNKARVHLLLSSSCRGPLADALSNDEICHLILVRCFGVAVSHERPEESNMKDKTNALDASTDCARVPETALQLGHSIEMHRHSEILVNMREQQ